MIFVVYKKKKKKHPTPETQETQTKNNPLKHIEFLWITLVNHHF